MLQVKYLMYVVKITVSFFDIQRQILRSQMLPDHKGEREEKYEKRDIEGTADCAASQIHLRRGYSNNFFTFMLGN